MSSTQTLVIGGGPAGYVAAIRLARLGQKVILAEKHKLGGECLNYGCIPSKALIAAANVVSKTKSAKAWGVEFDGFRFDGAKLQAWKSQLLGNLNKGVAGLLKGNGVSVIEGEAGFLSSRSVSVKTAQGVEDVLFDHAVVATGSRTMEIPGFSIDGEFVIGSQQALDLKEIPGRMLVIGGGVIGLEIGTYYAKLGASVTVVEMMNQLLPGIDSEFVVPVARSLERMGVKVHLNSQAKSWVNGPNGVVVTVKTPEGDLEIPADKILFCVGRKPNTSALNLEAAGIETDAKGFIRVDEYGRTSAQGIYAIGDVSGGVLLAHRGSAQGLAVAEAIASGHLRKISEVPWAVFTDPEVAVVGLTQRQAQEQGMDVISGKFPLAALGRALASGEPDGYVKIVAERSTKKIIGAGVVAAHASDLISEMALAVRLGATLEDVASTIHPHPTLPEAWMEAADVALGQPIHILPPRPPAAVVAQ